MKLTAQLVNEINNHLPGFRIILNVNKKGYKYSCTSNSLVNISYRKYCETIEETEELLINRFIICLKIQNESLVENMERFINFDNKKYYLDKINANKEVIDILNKI